MIQSTDISLLAEALPFWEKLSSDEKNFLIENTGAVSYKKNSVIHTAEFECLGMLFVTEGSLRVYMLSEQGREITLYRLSAGELCILSAACVLQMITFDVCIDANSDCRVLQVGSAPFSQLMQQNLYVENFAYKLATERFSDVMWAMQQILFLSFDQRLATFLLEESAALGSDTLTLTHEEAARLLGSAREVVSRMLKYFSSEGWIQLSRGKITITDRKKLEALL